MPPRKTFTPRFRGMRVRMSPNDCDQCVLQDGEFAAELLYVSAHKLGLLRPKDQRCFHKEKAAQVVAGPWLASTVRA